MIRIAHRVNAIAQLQDVPRDLGVEVDLRAEGSDIIIHHDPFATGPRFEDWLRHYKHRLVILNVKEEGLEARLIDLMSANRIEDYFFLDQSFPFLVKTARQGEHRAAVRVSEFESIDTALSLAGKVDWVWVDCFTKFPLSRADADRLRGAGFKLCFVSPELQGRLDPAHVTQYRNDIAAAGIVGDAVCTKYPQLWA